MTTTCSLAIAGSLATVSFLGSCTVTRPDTPQARQAQMYGLVQKFDRFDENGDGYLTRREMKDGVAETGGIQFTEEEWARIMRAYDTNRDGRISQREAQRGAERGPGIFDQGS